MLKYFKILSFRNASIVSARGRISVMRTIYIKWTQTGVAYLGQWHFRKKWEFLPKKGLKKKVPKFQSANEIKIMTGSFGDRNFCPFEGFALIVLPYTPSTKKSLAFF